MNFILLLFIAFISSICFSFGQVVDAVPISDWKTKLHLGASLNQASFSSNWKAGGVNSIGLSMQLNGKADYKKNKSTWNNELNFLYGLQDIKGTGYRKTLDLIYLDSKYGYELNKNWGLFTSLNLLSQFTKGYQYNDDGTKNLISDLFAPAFITSAWGMEYHPVDYFKARISPITPRITIVNDPKRLVPPGVTDLTPYGVELDENIRFEFGFQIFAEFDKDIAKNMNLKAKYMFFGNYADLTGEKIDHRLELAMVAKVNRFIDVSLGGILIYDYDQTKEVQLSQALTIGLAYSIQNFKEKE